MSAPAYVGIGANAGDAVTTVRAAIRELGRLGSVRASSLWETEPVGGVRDQPWFVNACAELRFRGEPPSPHALLEELLAIERRFGRDRAREVRGGPRALDLDLLVWGDLVVDGRGGAGLVLPHPRLAARAFALAPLVELAGEGLVIPGFGPAGPLLSAACADPTQRVRKIV